MLEGKAMRTDFSSIGFYNSRPKVKDGRIELLSSLIIAMDAVERLRLWTRYSRLHAMVDEQES